MPMYPGMREVGGPSSDRWTLYRGDRMLSPLNPASDGSRSLLYASPESGLQCLSYSWPDGHLPTRGRSGESKGQSEVS